MTVAERARRGQNDRVRRSLMQRLAGLTLRRMAGAAVVVVAIGAAVPLQGWGQGCPSMVGYEDFG